MLGINKMSNIKSNSGDSNQFINIGLTILAIVILLFLIGSYYNNRKDNKEKFDNPSEKNLQYESGPLDLIQTNDVQCQQHQQHQLRKQKPVTQDIPKGHPKLKEIDSNQHLEPTNNTVKSKNQNQKPQDVFPRDVITPGELLPNDPNSKWAQANPCGSGELGDQNFLEAGFHIGTNTVGQTLRNPNLQLRSEPANPQLKVSPWLQSTIEPDVGRKALEIGGC